MTKTNGTRDALALEVTQLRGQVLHLRALVSDLTERHEAVAAELANLVAIGASDHRLALIEKELGRVADSVYLLEGR